MSTPVQLSHNQIDTTRDQFRKLTVGTHRNSLSHPRTGSATLPITIPPRRASRRSFELAKTPTPRSRSSTLPGSSPTGSSPEQIATIFNDSIFLQAVEAYGKGNSEIDPILRLIRKYPVDINALMKDDGPEVMKRLGAKQVECICKLIAIDAKTFSTNVPLRENTPCTAFYREFCNFHFAKSLKQCAQKKEFLQVIKDITQVMKKQDVEELRVIHNVLREHIPSKEIANFKAFVVVVFINRVVAPIFTIKSGESPKESSAEIYKELGKKLQKGSSMYLKDKGESLSQDEIHAFDALADLLYRGK